MVNSDEEISETSCEVVASDDSEVDSSDESSIDKELAGGKMSWIRARQEARDRSKPISAEGNSSYQRNVLRQMQTQSKTIASVATSLTKFAESGSSSTITSNRDLISEIEAINKAKEVGVYDDAEAAQQIKQAKAALHKHQSSI